MTTKRKPKTETSEHRMIGEIDEQAMFQMRTLGWVWAAYRNVDLGHPNRGHLQFLRVGPGCTFTEPPAAYPFDTPEGGLGWRYRYEGRVNLETGAIEPWEKV